MPPYSGHAVVVPMVSTSTAVLGSQGSDSIVHTLCFECTQLLKTIMDSVSPHVNRKAEQDLGRRPYACWHTSVAFRILVSFFIQPSIFQQWYLVNGLSTHHHFSTKLILITKRSSTTNWHLPSFKFTQVNKSHSQHSVAAVRCEGSQFLMLYAYACVVLFPSQIPRSLFWEWD